MKKRAFRVEPESFSASLGKRLADPAAERQAHGARGASGELLPDFIVSALPK
jgi:hypothetical protein